MAKSPEKGEIFRLRDGGTSATKPRPVLVLSRRELNGGLYVLVAPFTTQKLAERAGKSQFVEFDGAGDPDGIYEPCVAQLDAVTQIEFRSLDTRLGVIGKLSQEDMVKVDQCLRYVFSID